MAVGMFLVFWATLGLGVRFNIPKNCLLVSSMIASLSFGFVEVLTKVGASSAEAAFVGAFLVAMSAEILARIMKVPSPVLSIPGIIPLVPGNMAYRSVIHLVKGEEFEGLGVGTKVVLTAVGIASGLLLASAISRKVMGPVFWGKVIPYRPTTASGDEFCPVSVDADQFDPDQTETSPQQNKSPEGSPERPE